MSHNLLLHNGADNRLTEVVGVSDYFTVELNYCSTMTVICIWISSVMCAINTL